MLSNSAHRFDCKLFQSELPTPRPRSTRTAPTTSTCWRDQNGDAEFPGFLCEPWHRYGRTDRLLTFLNVRAAWTVWDEPHRKGFEVMHI
jgi:hypothetical protein